MSATQLGIAPDLLQKGDYYATVLVNSVTGEMVLSFRGTDDAKGDLFNDIVQGAGVTTDQYANALKLAETLNLNFPNKSITVTGHSLGGGLASIAALKLGTDAIIFNAAGLHPKVAADANLSVAYTNANDNITNVTVDGEALTTLQESGTFKVPGTGKIIPPIPAVYVDPPEAIGNHIVLDAPSDSWLKNNSQYTPFDWINNSELVKSGTKHRMISVMESIEQQQRAKGCRP